MIVDCKRETVSVKSEFELGLWNAWIFMLYWILSNVLPLLLSGWLIDKEVLKKGSGTETLSETEKKISHAVSFPPFVLFVYSIFLPLKLGTTMSQESRGHWTKYANSWKQDFSTCATSTTAKPSGNQKSMHHGAHPK